MTRRRYDYETERINDRIASTGLAAYGTWVATLARWTHFITLTHDPARLQKIRPTWTQVGPRSHRRRVRQWVLDSRENFDRSLVWWSEMETLPTGAAHEHALAAWAPNAPIYSAMQVWFDRCGSWDVKAIEGGSEIVAAYIGKYGGKSGAFPPFVVGLGVHGRESFSVAAGPLLRSR